MDKFSDSIVVVADEATCTGFRLAGVTQTFSTSEFNAGEKISELLQLENIGIIIVTEKILANLDWRLRKKVDLTAKPVVVAVPDKDGPSEEAESLKNLIKRALGFELKN